MVPLEVMCSIDSGGDEDKIGYAECGKGIRHVLSFPVCGVSNVVEDRTYEVG
jgi:hypothetical protein